MKSVKKYTIVTILILSLIGIGNCDNVIVEKNEFYNTWDSIFNYASIIHKQETKERGSTNAQYEYYNLGNGNVAIRIKETHEKGKIVYEYAVPEGKKPILNMISEVNGSHLSLAINGKNTALQIKEGNETKIAMLIDGEYMSMGWSEDDAKKVKEFIYDNDLINRYNIVNNN